MRIRTENPHKLPPRLYERTNKRNVVWFYKYPDGSPRVLASAPLGDDGAIFTGRTSAVERAVQIIAAGIKSPGDKPLPLPKPRKRPERVRPIEKKDLTKAPMWAWGLYRKAKADAHRRQIPWQLNPEEFAWLIQQSAGRCAVTNIKLEIPSTKRRGPFGPSLDRIESDKPYHLDNLRLVCVAANIAMNAWGLEVFMRLARAAVAHQSESHIPTLEYKPAFADPTLASTSALTLANMAEWTGLEPATPGVTGRSPK